MTWLMDWLSTIPCETWGYPKYQNRGELHELSDQWLNSNFGMEWKGYVYLKLTDFSGYNLHIRSILVNDWQWSFLIISFVELMVLKVYFFMQHEYVMTWQHASPIRPHQKKFFGRYSWRTCSRWLDALIPWWILHEITYAIVVSVPIENMTEI
jgi:hypothetical protein